MGPPEMPPDWVPYGVHSFADLKARQEVDTKARSIRLVTEQFKAMVGNILDQYSFAPDGVRPATPQERIAKIRELLAEMETELGAAFREPVTETVLPEQESLAEASLGHAVRVSEDNAERGPLKIVAELIRPGWGNKKDQHYYPSETLRGESIRIWEGTKMHEVDHREEQRSNENWVSTVGKHVGYSDSGGALFEVAVHDPMFAQKVRNLAELNLLDKLECSILGDALVRKGFEQDGRKGGLVECFTVARNVDWVSHAGAGGRAVGLAESDAPEARQEVSIVKVDRNKLIEALSRVVDEALGEKATDVKLDDLVQEAIAEAEVPEPEPQPEPESQPEPEQPVEEAKPVVVDAERVRAMCVEARLPVALTDVLCLVAFETEEAVAARIAEQKTWIQQASKAGKPWGIAESAAAPVSGKRLSAEEYEAEGMAIVRRYTGR